MTNGPSLSVIVITHNREAQVVECVRMLSGVMAGRHELELIVVLDDCSDRSQELLESLRPRFCSRFVLEPVQANSPALARNRGAELAQGRILLFLDDDVQPCPGLLDAHLASQRSSDVVIGYLEPGFSRESEWWQLGARLWWEDRFTAMRQTGYQMGYRDLFSANFSVKAALFRSLGGFDANCPRLEDYELGIRLLKAGASFRYDPKASVVHRETGTYRQWLGRASLEALGEIHIGRKHPDYRKSAFQERLTSDDPWLMSWKTRIRTLAFKRSHIMSMMVRWATSSLPFLESSKARHTWKLFMGGVHEYNYWACIARHYGTASEFFAWIEGS